MYDGVGRLVRLDRPMPEGYTSPWRKERYVYDGVRRIATQVNTPPLADPGGMGAMGGSLNDRFAGDSAPPFVGSPRRPRADSESEDERDESGFSHSLDGRNESPASVHAGIDIASAPPGESPPDTCGKINWGVELAEFSELVSAFGSHC